MSPPFVRHVQCNCLFDDFHFQVFSYGRSLDQDEEVRCENDNCQEILKTVSDCVSHSSKCGYLKICEKCEKQYKSRAGYRVHSCKPEKVVISFLFLLYVVLGNLTNIDHTKFVFWFLSNILAQRICCQRIQITGDQKSANIVVKIMRKDQFASFRKKQA